MFSEIISDLSELRYEDIPAQIKFHLWTLPPDTGDHSHLTKEMTLPPNVLLAISPTVPEPAEYQVTQG